MSARKNSWWPSGFQNRNGIPIGLCVTSFLIFTLEDILLKCDELSHTLQSGLPNYVLLSRAYFSTKTVLAKMKRID